jgi:hypothetical protein
MRHKSITAFNGGVIRFCRKCAGVKRLSAEQCSDTTCEWYADRMANLDASTALSVFTYLGFKVFARAFFTDQSVTFLEKMWCSELREMLQEHIRECRFAPPKSAWIPHVFQEILPLCGWERTEQHQTHPEHRSREYLYRKVSKQEVKAA